MTGFATLGALVIASTLGFGVYWLITNITFKRQPERYVYVKNEDGSESVKDMNENEKL
jgi:hypothetical protein